MMDSFFTFEGEPSTKFSVFLEDDHTNDSAERDYETASVPGMDGDILYSNGRLKNGTLPYNCWIADDYVANARKLRNFLLSVEGYGRLEDTRHPEEFRKAFFRGPQNFDDVVAYTAGKFTINFEVKPQRWLKSGEEWKTVNKGSIYNKELWPAQPIIRVYGNFSTAQQVSVGDYVFTVKKCTGYVDIDCEMQDAYNDSGSQNTNVNIVEFPVLVPGDNQVDYDSGVTGVDILPRWWRV